MFEFPAEPSPAFLAAATLQLLLFLGGCGLLWQRALRPAVRRAPRTESPLGTWNLPLPEFALACIAVISGGIGAQLLLQGIGSALRAKGIGVEGNLWQILNGAAFQLGLLLGALAGWAFTRPAGSVTATTAPTSRPIRAGVAAFVAMMPVLMLLNALWTLLLQAAGLPIDQQTAVGLFASAETPAERILMTILAVVIAPIAEELIFRAGLFRYLRTRVPRWLALLGPAMVFATLHVEWTTLNGLAAFAPLVALAVTFSLVYERTGRIEVTMIAHALFNLNTILLLLAGVSA